MGSAMVLEYANCPASASASVDVYVWLCNGCHPSRAIGTVDVQYMSHTFADAMHMRMHD